MSEKIKRRWISGTLTITLESDACPASGIGRGADIDVDVCFDPDGLPTIPGRRIKGCLREAAEVVRDVVGGAKGALDRLFGTLDEQGSLRVGNAQVAGREDVLAVKRAEKASREEMCDCFLTLRRQTALDDDGRAKDATLRTLRVIRKGVAFTARVELAGVTDGDEAFWKETVAAWRTLGANVTRGLGRIRAEWTDVSESKVEPPPDAPGEGGTGTLRYRVELLRPALVSGFDAARTEDALSGTVMRGCVSALYMRAHNLDPHIDQSDNTGFRPLFVRGGNVRFLTALPCTPDGARAFPAPLCVLRDKRDKNKLYDIGAEWPDDKPDKKPDDKNQPTEKRKPMGGAYLTSLTDASPTVIRPTHRMGYHHSAKGEGALFTYDALEAGQTFAGEIVGDMALLRKLEPLLKPGSALQIGRSRTAEYGLARVTDANLAPDGMPKTQAESDRWLAVAVSPVCLMDDTGHAAQGRDAFGQALREALGAARLDVGRFFSQTMRSGGYNVQWRLSKPIVSAYAPGTAMQFSLGEKASLPERVFVGARQREGMGEVALFPLDALWREAEATATAAPDAASPDTSPNAAPRTPRAQEIAARLTRMRKEREAFALAQSQRGTLEKQRGSLLNATTIGYLAELLRVAPDWAAFDHRLEAIADADKRKKIRTLLIDGDLGISKKYPQNPPWYIQRRYLLGLLEEMKLLLRTRAGDAARPHQEEGAET